MLVLDRAMLQFRHELARRAIEGSIAPARRRALHQKVVDILKKRPDARASEIAHHAERAADVAVLLNFAQRAGEEAARAGAPREAAAHFAAMLRHRDALDPAVAVKTLEDHAEQSYLLGAGDAATVSMSEAACLRRASKNIAGLGRDLTRLSRFAWMCGRRPDAERYIDEAICVLQTIPVGSELAWAYSHQSQLDMLASRMDRAVIWGEKAISLANRLGENEIIIHALANVGSAKADHLRSGVCAEIERSFELAVAGNYHDHVERASCNLTCLYYWRRDYQLSLACIERGVAYAAALELTHWEGYLRGWRAMIRLDQGDWNASEEEAQEICSRTYAADVYRFAALVALARLRVRRGDQDADTPLEAARQISAGMGELQRSAYIAVVDAEKAWLSGGGETAVTEIDSARTRLQEVNALARERNASWAVEDSALWLHMLGERSEGAAAFSPPVREHCEER